MRTKSKIVQPVIIALSISFITIATLIVIATTALDKKEIKASRQLIRSGLFSLQDILGAIAFEFASWDEAYTRIVEKNDLAWAGINFGMFLAAKHRVTALFAIGLNGETLMGFIDGKPSSMDAYSFFGDKLFHPVQEACLNMDTSTGARFGQGFTIPQNGLLTDRNNVTYTLTVCAFTPQVASLDYVPKIRPVIVMAQPLDQTALDKISQLTGIEKLRMVPFSHRVKGSSIDIKDIAGDVIGRLTWEVPSDGRNLLLSILPAVILSLIGVGCFTRIFLKKEIDTRKKTEKILMKAKEELEDRVSKRTQQLLKRTKELDRANENLEKEIQLRSQIEKEMMVVSEREQRNIGQEIHDGLCQQLTGVVYLSSAVEGRLKGQGNPEVDALKKIIGLLGEILDQAYTLSRGICPLSLDPESLPTSLSELANNLKKLYDINCDYSFNGWHVAPDPMTALHLYRIAQEALNNTVKHARATKAIIRLGGNRKGQLSLVVADNGSGFDKSQSDNKSGMGLKIMAYRTHIIGGEFEVNTLSAGGTEVCCHIPMAKKESE